MKNKILIALLCGFFLLSITGCGNQQDSVEEKSDQNSDLPAEQMKFNLNDNLEVYTSLMGEPDGCGFSMFATNLKDIFPDATIDSYNKVSYWLGPKDDAVDGEISEEDLKDKIDHLEFDLTKENNAKEVMEEVKNNIDHYSGMKDFSYSYDNHRFYYYYWYLEFEDSQYSTDATVINEKVNHVFKDSIRFHGTCGGTGSTEILTEELCDEYQLECDRW